MSYQSLTRPGRGISQLTPMPSATERHWKQLLTKLESGREAEQILRNLVVDDIINREYLIRAFGELASDGGQAPGLDGVTFSDLSPGNVAEICDRIHRALVRGTYRPGESRKVEIPKELGGTRILSLRNILERVVSRSILNTLQIPTDRLFSPLSFGFRPKRGVETMMAFLLSYTRVFKCWVVATDDIKQAFDHVRIEDVINDLRRYTRNRGILRIIETVVTGGSDPTRQVGLEQGDPLSPLLLNLRLHHVHDIQLHPQPVRVNPLVLRYADNMVYLARSVSDCQQLQASSKAALSEAGLTLKGKDGPPVNLRSRQSIHILGYDLTLEDGSPRLRVSAKAWDSLDEHLQYAYAKEPSPTTGRNVVRGWINAYGIAIGEKEESEATDRVLEICARHGYRELITRTHLVEQIKRVNHRMARLRSNVINDLKGNYQSLLGLP